MNIFILDTQVGSKLWAAAVWAGTPDVTSRDNVAFDTRGNVLLAYKMGNFLSSDTSFFASYSTT